MCQSLFVYSFVFIYDLFLFLFFSAREAAQIAQSQVAWNIAEAAKWITGV